MSLLASASRESPMYEEYYGFAQSPFTLAPDPRFLYRSESHGEALALLQRAIKRKEGFIVLTGDIGTGKTTSCRALLEQLDPSVFTALILNPFLTCEELVRELLLDFGVVSRDAVRSGRLAHATKHELISVLHDFLLSLMPIGGSAVLIIDEAQHLAPEVLEQIRVISNLETSQAKLLQIVLVGQLNLLDVLRTADMRPLDQRISSLATLRPLSAEEVAAYVAHRLTVANGTTPVSFADSAIERVHAYSGGVPRVINLICDRALMRSAARGTDRVTADMVDDAARELRLTAAPVVEPPLEAPTPRSRRGLVLSVAGAVLVALALAVWLVPVDRLVAAPPPPLPGVPRSGAVVSVVPPAAPADLTATGWTPTGTIPFNDIPGALELPVELPGPVEPVFGR